MKITKTIPESVDVEHTLTNINFSIVRHSALVRISVSGKPIKTAQVDCAAIWAIMTGTQRTVVKTFFRKVVADSMGIPLSSVPETIFQADPEPETEPKP